MSGLKAPLLVVPLFAAPRSTPQGNLLGSASQGADCGKRLLAGLSQCYGLNVCAPPDSSGEN